MIGNDMKTQMILRGASLLALAVLTACGGGGDGGSTTSTPKPVKTTCDNGGLNFPVCSLPGALQQELPSKYAFDSNEYKAFAEINRIRKAVGLGVWNHNPLIDKAAQNHANYLQLSFVSGDNAHTEKNGRAGFTGEGTVERFNAVGLNFSASGEVMAAQTGQRAIQILMSGILHRDGLLGDSATDVGMVSNTLSGTIVDYGFSKPQYNNGDFIGIYPVDGDTDVALTHGMESPNPFEGELEMTVQNMCTKTSYPVSIISESSTTLTTTSFTIREYGAAKDLDVRFAPLRSTGNHVAIIGKAPFKPLQRYEVKFVGKVKGGRSGAGFDVVKNWSFTTSVKNLITCNF
jgi:uncharacterized protein YkwD